MPSLERFFDPQMRKFDANVRPLPGARLYFFESGTTTPKSTYKDKQGEVAHANPVIADPTGVFPQIFLDGLYRVELRSSANIVQPGWPIDNIGQDSPIVPFGPWSEIVTYAEGEVVTATNGNWYRSIGNDNLGNEPSASPSEWELIPIPVSGSFTSNVDWITFSDSGDQISLDVDVPAMVDETILVASRSSDNERASTTTLAEDEELFIPDLEFNTSYAIRGFIVWTGGPSISNGFKMKLSVTNLDRFRISYMSNTEQLTSGVGDPANILLAYTSAVQFQKVQDGALSAEVLIIDGYIKTNASGPENPYLSLDWAQVSSSATPTTIQYGSYISAMKL